MQADAGACPVRCAEWRFNLISLSFLFLLHCKRICNRPGLCAQAKLVSQHAPIHVSLQFGLGFGDRRLDALGPINCSSVAITVAVHHGLRSVRRFRRVAHLQYHQQSISRRTSSRGGTCSETTHEPHDCTLSWQYSSMLSIKGTSLGLHESSRLVSHSNSRFLGIEHGHQDTFPRRFTCIVSSG